MLFLVSQDLRRQTALLFIHSFIHSFIYPFVPTMQFPVCDLTLEDTNQDEEKTDAKRKEDAIELEDTTYELDRAWESMDHIQGYWKNKTEAVALLKTVKKNLDQVKDMMTKPNKRRKVDPITTDEVKAIETKETGTVVEAKEEEPYTLLVLIREDADLTTFLLVPDHLMPTDTSAVKTLLKHSGRGLDTASEFTSFVLRMESLGYKQQSTHKAKYKPVANHVVRTFFVNLWE